MKPLERAAILRNEADFIIEQVGLHEALKPYRVVFTGSYYLDTMVYPDIDLYISMVTIERLFNIGAALAAADLVYEVVFQKSRNPALPGGLYLKGRITYGKWGRPWKIDIWSLEESLIDKNMLEMQRFKDQLTEPLREQIIHYKYSLLTDEHRTPMFSGVYIYRAFIDEGLSDFNEVTQYLIDHGIQIG
jgi:hypothetical protein